MPPRPSGDRVKPRRCSRVSLFPVEPVAEPLVGQVGVDVGEDAVAESAQDARFELGGVADQDRFDLVDQSRLFIGDVGQDPADRDRLTGVDGTVADGVGQHWPCVQHLTQSHQQPCFGRADA